MTDKKYIELGNSDLLIDTTIELTELQKQTQFYNPEKDKYPQMIYLDLSENNPDNSFKLYHSREGLKDPFVICSISRKFKHSKDD